LSSTTPSICPQATVPSIGAPADGEAEDEGEMLREVLDEGLTELLGLTESEVELDGEAEAEGLTLALGLTDGDPVNCPTTSTSPTAVGEAALSVNDAPPVEPVALKT
jgi:hypothetical protein